MGEDEERTWKGWYSKGKEGDWVKAEPRSHSSTRPHGPMSELTLNGKHGREQWKASHSLPPSRSFASLNSDTDPKYSSLHKLPASV